MNPPLLLFSLSQDTAEPEDLMGKPN